MQRLRQLGEPAHVSALAPTASQQTLHINSNWRYITINHSIKLILKLQLPIYTTAEPVTMDGW